jgi:hypothetical protein
MTIQSILKTMLVTAALLAMASVATAGGNTIAGSDKPSVVSAGMSHILVSGLSIADDSGPDVCATIINRSADTGLITLTLTDAFAATRSTTIPKSKSLGLCLKDTESVEVACEGPSRCVLQWSVDQF